MKRRTYALLAALLGLLGCTGASRVSDRFERSRGALGWFRIYPHLSLDSGDALVLPKKTQGDGVDEDAQYMERVAQVYQRQFKPLYLHEDTPCYGITGDEQAPPPGPVFILVPGIRGDGPEWWSAVAVLDQTRPAAMFMLKWNPMDERGIVLTDLVDGVNVIANCYPEARPLVLLAHSAGGVVSSFAVSRLAVPSSMHLELFTVAAPLAGTGWMKAVADDDDNSHLFNELGASRQEYPAASPRISVTHLRTSAPADPVMEPNRWGYSPNRKGVGVKGAREIDLPTTLNHDAALFYVAKQLATGRLQ